MDAESQTVYFTNDNHTFDSTRVEIDESGPRPKYKFKKVKGTLDSTKISYTILPAKQAFDDFGNQVLPAAKVSQLREVFQPDKRGFKLPLEKADFYKKYVSLVGKDAPTDPPAEEILMG